MSDIYLIGRWIDYAEYGEDRTTACAWPLREVTAFAIDEDRSCRFFWTSSDKRIELLATVAGLDEMWETLDRIRAAEQLAELTE